MRETFGVDQRAATVAEEARAQIEVAEGGTKLAESEFNGEFISRLLSKLDWAALRQTAA